jgi:hypothetical protein
MIKRYHEFDDFDDVYQKSWECFFYKYNFLPFTREYGPGILVSLVWIRGLYVLARFLW